MLYTNILTHIYIFMFICALYIKYHMDIYVDIRPHILKTGPEYERQEVGVKISTDISTPSKQISITCLIKSGMCICVCVCVYPSWQVGVSMSVSVCVFLENSLLATRLYSLNPLSNCLTLMNCRSQV